MKYDIKFSCGHTETVQLFGKESERYRKIAFFEEQGQCSCCYQKQKNEKASNGCHKETMLYRDYKNGFSEFETERGSYNPETKEINVFIPDDRAEFLYRKIKSAYQLGDLEELIMLAGTGEEEIAEKKKYPDYEDKMKKNAYWMADFAINKIKKEEMI